MSVSGALQKTIYRNLLRWGSNLRKEGVPVQLSATDVQQVLPELVPGTVPLPDRLQELQVETLTKWAFRHSRNLQGWEKEEAIDRSLQALYALNSIYMEDVLELQRMRASHSDSQGITYPVGTVFRHRRHGYLGVVAGWDRACARDDAWATERGLDPQQPFYTCLPDEHDFKSKTKELRLSRYTAQENIVPVTTRRVCHRKMDALFSGYSEALGRYVPSARLAFEYPDDYPPPTTDCAADSNILLHADWSFAGEPATCGADDVDDHSMWAAQSAAGTKLEGESCGWQGPHPHEVPSQAAHEAGGEGSPCPHCGTEGAEHADNTRSPGMGDCPHCGDQQIIRDQFEWSRDQG